MSKDNKAIYKRMAGEIWNKGKLELIDELYAEDVIRHGAQAGSPEGREGVRSVVSMWRNGFTGFAVTPRILVAEGDMLAIYWTINGTHSREFMEIPATGKEIQWDGMSLARFEDGKIVELWGGADQLALMQQLGANPS